MKGDCLERMREIESGSVDLTVTSPPYDNLRNYNNSLDWGEHVWKPVLQELFRVTKKGGVVVWVVGDATIKGSETGTSFKQALYAKEVGFNLHDTMIYQKSTPPLSHNRYEQNFEYMFIFSKGKPKTFNGIRESREYMDKRKNKAFGKNKDDSIDYGFSSKREMLLPHIKKCIPFIARSPRGEPWRKSPSRLKPKAKSGCRPAPKRFKRPPRLKLSQIASPHREFLSTVSLASFPRRLCFAE